MVSSYKVVNPSLGYRTFAVAPRFAKLAYSHASLALSPRCRARSAWAVRPASLAASAPYSACRRALVKVTALCGQAWACHAGTIAGFGHAGFAVQAPISEHFMHLPVSQLLTPQSSARTVLHQSICFSCAAHLPFVGLARSAHVLAFLVFEARARRLSAAA